MIPRSLAQAEALLRSATEEVVVIPVELLRELVLDIGAQQQVIRTSASVLQELAEGRAWGILVASAWCEIAESRIVDELTRTKLVNLLRGDRTQSTASEIRALLASRNVDNPPRVG